MRNWDLARFATVAEIGASIGVITLFRSRAVTRYYAHKDGEIREELWKGIESGLTGSLASNKGFRKFWRQKGSILS
jgi:hypothetical protein